MRDSVDEESVCKGLRTKACGHGRRAWAQALAIGVRGPGNPITLGVPPAVCLVAPRLLSHALRVEGAWWWGQSGAGSQTVWIQTLSPAAGEREACPAPSSASSSQATAVGVRSKRHMG